MTSGIRSIRRLALVSTEERPVSNVPGLVPSAGEKRDCSNYERCLDKHLRAHLHAREPEASCVVGCRWFEPVRDSAVNHMTNTAWNPNSAAPDW